MTGEVLVPTRVIQETTTAVPSDFDALLKVRDG